MVQEPVFLLREHNPCDAGAAIGCSCRCCYLQLVSHSQKPFTDWNEAQHQGQQHKGLLLKQEMKVKDSQKQALVWCFTHNSFSSHLHATNSDSNNSWCTLLTFTDLVSLLLFWCIVSMLSGSHLKVQHTWYFISRCQVFQQNEFWKCWLRNNPHSTTTGFSHCYHRHSSVVIPILSMPTKQ